MRQEKTFSRRALADAAIMGVLTLSCGLMFAWDTNEARLRQEFRAQVRQIARQVKARPSDSVCLADGTCFKRPR